MIRETLELMFGAGYAAGLGTMAVIVLLWVTIFGRRKGQYP